MKTGIISKMLAVPLLSIFLAASTHGVLAISDENLRAAVKIVCPDNYGNWFSGTGTLIDPSGIILTNKHVVLDGRGNVIPACFVGFISNARQEPDFGSQVQPNIATVEYTTSTSDMDAALLYLADSKRAVLPFTNIWDSDASALQLGQKLEIVGFPSIGGQTITYTSGDFSGFGDASSGTGNYLKSSVPIEHGNSGGAAYNIQGKFMGMPTMAVTGSINSLSYLLSVNSIQKWLLSLASRNKPDPMPEVAVKNATPSIEIQEDIIPPDISRVDLTFYDCSNNFTVRDTLGQLEPTHSPIIASDCKKIVYEADKVYPYSSATLFAEITIPNDVLADTAKYAYDWGHEINIKPILKEGGLRSMKNGVEDFTGWNNYEALDGFKTLWPSSGEKGSYYYSLQLMDEKGNASDARVWKYTYGDESASQRVSDPNLVARVSGKILLQVQSHGEAWYINPDDGKRYYMKNGAAAFAIMRKFALGITNDDLARIPINSSEATGDKKMIERLRGKILLQVEQQGDAWYLNPANGKRYFMGRPEDAYRLMRTLGLGVTNQDLEMIPIGDINY